MIITAVLMMVATESDTVRPEITTEAIGKITDTTTEM
jgi:hypothetical protein